LSRYGFQFDDDVFRRKIVHLQILKNISKTRENLLEKAGRRSRKKIFHVVFVNV
jgi:hypothetical protein